MKPVRIRMKRRSIFMFVLINVIVIYGMVSFIDDIAFFFHGTDPVELGGAMKPKTELLGKLEEGSYVELSGIRGHEAGKISRGMWKDQYLISYFTVAGPPNFVILEKIGDGEKKKIAYDRTTVKGRIYAFGKSEHARRLRDFFKNTYATDLGEEGYLINATVQPGSDYRAVVFFTVLLLILLMNLLFFMKGLARKKTELDI